MTRRPRELIEMAHELAYIKDERDDYRRWGSFMVQPLFREIGRRASLSLKEITQLTRSEMIEFLSTQRMTKRQAIRERLRHGYVLIRKHGGPIEVFEGAAARKLINKEFSQQATRSTGFVKGMAGSAGRAIGRAQVIYTKHDLKKVQPGDVMVAVTTHPDFVPAMRRCCAIVTDEGGITAHAAIVSRELKIPCVVGTKVATQAFKSGDRIEVDASRGIVRKL